MTTELDLAHPGNPSVSVVVPVYSEADNLETLHDSLVPALQCVGFEVLYVDDGSIDGSAAVLDGIAAADHRARVIHFVRNHGQTATPTAGIRNVAEVPVRHRASTRGTSRYGLARIPTVVSDLTTLKFLRGFFVTPIHAFGVVEVTLGIIAEVLTRRHHELQGKEPCRIGRTENMSPRSELQHQARR